MLHYIFLEAINVRRFFLRGLTENITECNAMLFKMSEGYTLLFGRFEYIKTNIAEV